MSQLGELLDCLSVEEDEEELLKTLLVCSRQEQSRFHLPDHDLFWPAFLKIRLKMGHNRNSCQSIFQKMHPLQTRRDQYATRCIFTFVVEP